MRIIDFRLRPPIGSYLDGNLRGLSVTTVGRSPAASAIPTIAESSIPGCEASVWVALLAPGQTPRNVIELLNLETVRVLKYDSVKHELLTQGAQPVAGTAAQIAEMLKSDVVRHARVILESGTHVE